jgi:hypothetical protein
VWLYKIAHFLKLFDKPRARTVRARGTECTTSRYAALTEEHWHSALNLNVMAGVGAPGTGGTVYPALGISDDRLCGFRSLSRKENAQTETQPYLLA